MGERLGCGTRWSTAGRCHDHGRRRCGLRREYAGHGSLNFVVGLDPVSGAVLWEDQLDRSPDDSVASAVAIDRNRVFVAGATRTPSGQDLLLRAYDASSGRLTWEFAHQVAFPTALKAISGRVFLTGSASSQPYIAAFESKSGLLLWDDAPSMPGAFNEIAVKHNESSRPVPGEQAFSSARTTCEMDTWHGKTKRRSFRVMERSPRPSLLAMMQCISLVAVARISGTSEVLVRAYDRADGKLLWDDRSHRSPNSAAIDLALGKNRLFVAGYTYHGS